MRGKEFKREYTECDGKWGWAARHPGAQGRGRGWGDQGDLQRGRGPRGHHQLRAGRDRGGCPLLGPLQTSHR